MVGSNFPGRLVVSDEGQGLVHIDMYRVRPEGWLRISVEREMLRLYAQRFLEAANRPAEVNSKQPGAALEHQENGGLK